MNQQVGAVSTIGRGLAESIDHLICVEFRRSGATVNNGVIDPLYRAARARAGGPLAWMGGEALLDACSSSGGAPVYIATGHVHPVLMPSGETDGPLGAVALARAIVECTDAPVILLAEEVVVPILFAACNAAGLNVRDASALPLPRSVAVQSFPIDEAEARDAAAQMIAGAAAVVTVEKIGRCRGGGYRTGSGTDVTASLAKVDILVDTANASGVLTIGIGDLGNEIGMASIAETVLEVIRTGVGETIVSEVPTDHLIVAGCSNWGAYGMVAAIAAQTGTPSALHSGDLERYMLEAICAAGAVDGFTVGPTREVDGAGMRTHAAFADLLSDIVVIALDSRTPERHKVEIGARQNEDARHART